MVTQAICPTAAYPECHFVSPLRINHQRAMRRTGIEPVWGKSSQDFKSCASASSATLAWKWDLFLKLHTSKTTVLFAVIFKFSDYVTNRCEAKKSNRLSNPDDPLIKQTKSEDQQSFLFFLKLISFYAFIISQKYINVKVFIIFY